MIARDSGKVEGQILIEKVPFDSAIDHLPMICGKRGVQTLLEVVIDGVVVVDSPPIVDFRIKSFPAIGDRGAEQKYPNDSRLLFRRNLPVSAKSSFIQLNLVAVVAGIIAKGGPAVELQLDVVARRSVHAPYYVLRESEHRTD